MESNRRKGYGFTNEDKDYARSRANGKCEFPDCSEWNTGQVNHITGCFEAKLSNKLKDELVVFKDDKKSICDPIENAILLCDEHEIQHDEQEDYQIQALSYLDYVSDLRR